MDRISPNFIYAFILTTSTLGLLHIIYPMFVPELWPLIYTKISFLFNILRRNGQNFTKFYLCNHIDKIMSGLLHIIVCSSVSELWPLIYSKILFPLNILRTNGQILKKLYITIYTDKIYIGIVSCHFFQICKTVTAFN